MGLPEISREMAWRHWGHMILDTVQPAIKPRIIIVLHMGFEIGDNGYQIFHQMSTKILALINKKHQRNKYNVMWCVQKHWKPKVGMMPTLTPLAVPQVVVMTAATPPMMTTVALWRLSVFRGKCIDHFLVATAVINKLMSSVNSTLAVLVDLIWVATHLSNFTANLLVDQIIAHISDSLTDGFSA